MKNEASMDHEENSNNNLLNKFRVKESSIPIDVLYNKQVNGIKNTERGSYDNPSSIVFHLIKGYNGNPK